MRHPMGMLEHKVAKVAACAAFMLLIIGGMVNATGSSLACPEAVVICHKLMNCPTWYASIFGNVIV